MGLVSSLSNEKLGLDSFVQWLYLLCACLQAYGLGPRPVPALYESINVTILYYIGACRVQHIFLNDFMQFYCWKGHKQVFRQPTGHVVE